MRLRNQLLLAWGGLVVLLWAGTLVPVHATIDANFAAVADDAFNGARRGLAAMQTERTRRMRQACWMVMSVPELRALIAEHSYEISESNLTSLAERLDGIADLVGADFVFVLDNHASLVAQSRRSAWSGTAPGCLVFGETCPF